VLPHSTPPLGAFGRQKDANLGQGLSQFPAAVGQVPQEPPRYSIPQSRLVDEFFGKGDVRDVGCCELVGERHPVGSTQQVQLHAVDAEGAPPYPRSSRKASRLPNLARMQNFQQRRVYEQGFRLAYQNSGRISRRRGSIKRLSFLTRRLKEEGWSLATPGNR
jgi:hypothetical protein